MLIWATPCNGQMGVLKPWPTYFTSCSSKTQAVRIPENCNLPEKKLNNGYLRKLLIWFSTHFLMLWASQRQVQPAERGYTPHALPGRAMQGHKSLVGIQVETEGLPVLLVPYIPSFLLNSRHSNLNFLFFTNSTKLLMAGNKCKTFVTPLSKQYISSPPPPPYTWSNLTLIQLSLLG